MRSCCCSLPRECCKTCPSNQYSTTTYPPRTEPVTYTPLFPEDQEKQRYRELNELVKKW